MSTSGVLDRIPVRSIVLTALSIGLGSFLIIAVWKAVTLPEADRIHAGGLEGARLVAGVSLGAIYGLIALGYSLVYGILRMINFAHGEVFMAGGHDSFFVGRRWARTATGANPCSRLILLFLVGMRRPRRPSRSGWSASPTGRCGTRRGSCP